MELAVGNETSRVGDWPLNIYKACDPPLAKVAKALPPTPPLHTPPLPREESLPTVKGLFSSMPVPQPAVGGAEADALSLSDTIQRCELLQPPEPTRSEQIQNPNLPEAPPFAGISQEGGGYFACAFCMEEVGNEIIEGTFRNEPLIIVSVLIHIPGIQRTYTQPPLVRVLLARSSQQAANIQYLHSSRASGVEAVYPHVQPVPSLDSYGRSMDALYWLRTRPRT